MNIRVTHNIRPNRAFEIDAAIKDIATRSGMVVHEGQPNYGNIHIAFRSNDIKAFHTFKKKVEKKFQDVNFTITANNIQ